MPLWVAVVLGLSSPIVAIVALVAAEARDRRRLQQERRLKEKELDEARWSARREERREAYARLAGLTNNVDAEAQPSVLIDVAAALSSVQLLCEDPKVYKAASVLVDTWEKAWRRAALAHERGDKNTHDPALMGLGKQHQAEFVRLARIELELPTPASKPPALSEKSGDSETDDSKA